MKFSINGKGQRPKYQNTSLVLVFSYFPSHMYTLYFSLVLCNVLPRQIPGLDHSETDCIHNDRLVRILLLSLNWSPADCVTNNCPDSFNEVKTPREKHVLNDTLEVQLRADLLAPPPDPKVLFDLLEYIPGALHEVTVSFEGVDLNEVDETGVELRVEHVHYGQQ